MPQLFLQSFRETLPISDQDQENLEAFRNLLVEYCNNHHHYHNSTMIEALEAAHHRIPCLKLTQAEQYQYALVLIVADQLHQRQEQQQAEEEESTKNALDILVESLLQTLRRVRNLPSSLRPFFHDKTAAGGNNATASSPFDILEGKLQTDPFGLPYHLQNIARFQPYEDSWLILSSYFLVRLMMDHGEDDPTTIPTALRTSRTYNDSLLSILYIPEASAMVQLDAFLLNPFKATTELIESLFRQFKPENRFATIASLTHRLGYKRYCAYLMELLILHDPTDAKMLDFCQDIWNLQCPLVESEAKRYTVAVSSTQFLATPSFLRPSYPWMILMGLRLYQKDYAEAESIAVMLLRNNDDFSIYEQEQALGMIAIGMAHGLGDLTLLIKDLSDPFWRHCLLQWSQTSLPVRRGCFDMDILAQTIALKILPRLASWPERCKVEKWRDMVPCDPWDRKASFAWLQQNPVSIDAVRTAIDAILPYGRDNLFLLEHYDQTTHQRWRTELDEQYEKLIAQEEDYANEVEMQVEFSENNHPVVLTEPQTDTQQQVNEETEDSFNDAPKLQTSTRITAQDDDHHTLTYSDEEEQKMLSDSRSDHGDPATSISGPSVHEDQPSVGQEEEESTNTSEVEHLANDDDNAANDEIVFDKTDEGSSVGEKQLPEQEYSEYSTNSDVARSEKSNNGENEFIVVDESSSSNETETDDDDDPMKVEASHSPDIPHQRQIEESGYYAEESQTEDEANRFDDPEANPLNNDDDQEDELSRTQPAHMERLGEKIGSDENEERGMAIDADYYAEESQIDDDEDEEHPQPSYNSQEASGVSYNERSPTVPLPLPGTNVPVDHGYEAEHSQDDVDVNSAKLLQPTTSGYEPEDSQNTEDDSEDDQESQVELPVESNIMVSPVNGFPARSPDFQVPRSFSDMDLADEQTAAGPSAESSELDEDMNADQPLDSPPIEFESRGGTLQDIAGQVQAHESSKRVKLSEQVECEAMGPSPLGRDVEKMPKPAHLYPGLFGVDQTSAVTNVELEQPPMKNELNDESKTETDYALEPLVEAKPTSDSAFVCLKAETTREAETINAAPIAEDGSKVERMFVTSATTDEPTVKLAAVEAGTLESAERSKPTHGAIIGDEPEDSINNSTRSTPSDNSKIETTIVTGPAPANDVPKVDLATVEAVPQEESAALVSFNMEQKKTESETILELDTEIINEAPIAEDGSKAETMVVTAPNPDEPTEEVAAVEAETLETAERSKPTLGAIIGAEPEFAEATIATGPDPANDVPKVEITTIEAAPQEESTALVSLKIEQKETSKTEAETTCEAGRLEFDAEIVNVAPITEDRSEIATITVTKLAPTPNDQSVEAAVAEAETLATAGRSKTIFGAIVGDEPEFGIVKLSEEDEPKVETTIATEPAITNDDPIIRIATVESAPQQETARSTILETESKAENGPEGHQAKVKMVTMTSFDVAHGPIALTSLQRDESRPDAEPVLGPIVESQAVVDVTTGTTVETTTFTETLCEDIASVEPVVETATLADVTTVDKDMPKLASDCKLVVEDERMSATGAVKDEQKGETVVEALLEIKTTFDSRPLVDQARNDGSEFATSSDMLSENRSVSGLEYEFDDRQGLPPDPSISRLKKVFELTPLPDPATARLMKCKRKIRHEAEKDDASAAAETTTDQDKVSSESGEERNPEGNVHAQRSFDIRVRGKRRSSRQVDQKNCEITQYADVEVPSTLLGSVQRSGDSLPRIDEAGSDESLQPLLDNDFQKQDAKMEYTSGEKITPLRRSTKTLPPRPKTRQTSGDEQSTKSGRKTTLSATRRTSPSDDDGSALRRTRSAKKKKSDEPNENVEKQPQVVDQTPAKRRRMSHDSSVSATATPLETSSGRKIFPPKRLGDSDVADSKKPSVLATPKRHRTKKGAEDISVGSSAPRIASGSVVSADGKRRSARLQAKTPEEWHDDHSIQSSLASNNSIADEVSHRKLRLRSRSPTSAL